jgi:hypothetical protein
MRNDASLRVHPLLAIAAAVVLAASLAATGPAAEIAFGSQSTRLKPAKTVRNARALVFDLRGVDASRLARATLVHKGKRKGLNPAAVRRAAARGKITTTVPRSWIPAAAHRKHRTIRRKRQRIARSTRLQIMLHRRHSPSPPDPPTVSDQLRVGLVANAQGWDMSSQTVLNETEPTGARWLREEFSWSEIEPQDDSWQWSRYDHLMLEAADRNMRVLPVLIDTPKWAGPAWNSIPSDPAAFAQYAAKVTERYGPDGTFWQAHPEIASYAPDYFEIWNEPYLRYFSAGGVHPGRYARLVEAAATAGREANPSAKFLLAGEQTPAGDELHHFIDDMYAAVPDLNAYFDAVAVHPYGGSSAPDRRRGGWGFPRIAGIHRTFADHGAGDKPLWITEVGWSTCPKDPRYCTSERKQAAYLSEMFTLLSTKYADYVRAVFVYRSIDINSKRSDKEGWFGLERLDGSHKPAFHVFREAAEAGAP